MSKKDWDDAEKEAGKHGHYVVKVKEAMKAGTTDQERFIAMLKQLVANAEDMFANGASVSEVIEFGMSAVKKANVLTAAVKGNID